MTFKKIAFFVFITSLICYSCRISYSLKSGQAPTYAKRMVIPQFENISGAGPANLTILMSEKAREYYMRNTKMEILSKYPSNSNDTCLALTAEITNYSVDIAGVQATSNNSNANESGAQRKLTITIAANYNDPYKPSESFTNKSFTAFALFNSTQDLSSVENALIEDISAQIIQKIFTDSYDKW